MCGAARACHRVTAYPQSYLRVRAMHCEYSNDENARLVDVWTIACVAESGRARAVRGLELDEEITVR